MDGAVGKDDKPSVATLVQNDSTTMETCHIIPEVL